MRFFCACIVVVVAAVQSAICFATDGERMSKYSELCPDEGFYAPSEVRRQPAPLHEQPDVVPLSAAEREFRLIDAVERMRAVGVLLSQQSSIATATLVARDWVLTVSHKIPAAELLSDHLFAIDWSVDYSVPGKAKLDLGRHVRCFPIDYADIVVSAPGHLDYMLLRIRPDSAENGLMPHNYGVKPLKPEAQTTLPQVGEPVFLVGFKAYEKYPTDDLYYPEGIVAIGNGSVVGGNRWNKDVGSSRSIDYAIHTRPGLSGSPLLNSKHQWIGMHQRDLNLAKCDSLTPWHPYISTYYSDRFAGASLAAQVESRCDEVGKPPGLPRVRGDTYRKHELPRQATPIVDIAQDVAERRGMSWLCREIPAFAEMLPNLDMYSCDPRRRAQTFKVSVAADAAGGGESSAASSDGR
jgi:hypothetical protein